MKVTGKNKKYLIIGQGIAGSILAWTLMKAGHQVVIVDADHHESSSMISAGIINPLTGQRLALTSQFDLFSTCAHQAYSKMSAELGMNFFVSKPIIRVLRSQAELDRCRYLQNQADAKAYVAAINPPGHYESALHDPFGTLTIAKGGYVQAQLLLTALKKYFIAKKMLILEDFSYADLKVDKGKAIWRSSPFDAVIFCEGFKARGNPWFKDMPYNFVKGELLRIVFENAPLPDAILCQQQWCVPSGTVLDGTYLAGSTYDREHIDTFTTDEGQSVILKGLSDFIPAKARVIERFAGVRPVMLNPVPVAMMHSSIPCLGIFNGFGSKGFLWAPYYAEMFKTRVIS